MFDECGDCAPRNYSAETLAKKAFAQVLMDSPGITVLPESERGE